MPMAINSMEFGQLYLAFLCLVGLGFVWLGVFFGSSFEHNTTVRYVYTVQRVYFVSMPDEHEINVTRIQSRCCRFSSRMRCYLVTRLIPLFSVVFLISEFVCSFCSFVRFNVDYFMRIYIRFSFSSTVSPFCQCGRFSGAVYKSTLHYAITYNNNSGSWKGRRK